MGIHVSHTESSVVIELDPIDALFALKPLLEIPRAQIESIEVMRRNEVPRTAGTWLRLPGTYVPGLVRYGSYGTEPKRAFWLVRRQGRVVVIEIGNWSYHRVVLGCADPDRLAADLTARRSRADDGPIIERSLGAERARPG